MNILEIHMKHFGKFCEQKMSFHPGVNIIYGENETGKSTMHAFIRAMFFGLEKSRGRASKSDEYSLRMPWDNGSYFAGSIRFETGGKVYTLYRSFSKNEKEMQLYCETDGMEYDANQGNLEILLGGMNESTFSNTLYLGRQTGETDEGLAAAIRNFMVNAHTGGNPDVDMKRALDTLRREKKNLETEKKKCVTERVEKLQEIRMRMDYTRQELKELYDEEQKCRNHLKELKQKERQLETECCMEPEQERYRGNGKGIIWKVGKIFMALMAVGAMGAALLETRWEMRAVACAVILFSCLGVSVLGKQDQRYKEEKREWEIWQRERQMEQLMERQERLLRERDREAPIWEKWKMNLEWVQNTQREKEAVLQELEEQCQNMQNSNSKEKDLEEKLAAVYLAIETMDEVTAEMYQEFSGKLHQKVSEILSQITGGRYSRVFLDEEMQVRIPVQDRVLRIEQLSRGTVEQIYFALRMAAAELLNGGELLPVVLDDAFLTYDHVRLEHTLRWLCTCGRQVLLFSCHKREQEILEEIYNGIS